MTTQQDMSIYVIAHKNSDQLDAPVFHAGPKQEEEAIAVFTSVEQAERYIDKAKWSDDYEVGQLLPLQVLKWFQTAKEDGVDMVAINPDPSWTTFSSQEDVISLDDPYQAFSVLSRSERAIADQQRG